MSRRHPETDTQATQPQINNEVDGKSKKTLSVSSHSLYSLISESIETSIKQSLDKLDDHIEVLLGGEPIGKLVDFDTSKISIALAKDLYLKMLDNQLVVAKDEVDCPLEVPQKRKRGRPLLKQLCSKFSDAAIWPMAQTIFTRIYNYTIEKATDIEQFLVCMFCSLFRICDTDDPYGRVSYFHKLLGLNLKDIMPAKRTLQEGVRWLKDKSQKFFRNLKPEVEEIKHKAWERLEEKIYGIMVELTPQFAM